MFNWHMNQNPGADLQNLGVQYRVEKLKRAA